MQYVKEEIITTTVCDKELEDLDVIKKLIRSICETRVLISLSYQKKIQYEKKNNSYSKVKIIVVNDDTINIRIFTNKANFVIKDIPYTDVTSITILSSKNEFLVSKENIGRFDLLDID